jgi:hypothetical protein
MCVADVEVRVEVSWDESVIDGGGTSTRLLALNAVSRAVYIIILSEMPEVP